MNGAPKGFGPPAGTPVYPLDGLAQETWDTAGGPRDVRTDDPGFQPPGDPLQRTVQRPGIVYRDIPLVTIQNSWTVQQARVAMYSHSIGIFESSAQLCDSVMGDDRVSATLGSRGAGLFGRPIRIEPANDSAAAREVADAWQAHWPRLAGASGLSEVSDYEIMMGFSPAQLVWDTRSTPWLPYLRPWHPRYTYYHWQLRKFVALSQDGSIPITPGDGKWLLHSRFGYDGYRSWIRGALRAVVEPWMLRHFAFRDMARFSEVHGIPTRVGYTPAAADPGERSQFEQQLGKLGSETTLLIPRGIDKDMGYGYELVEATDAAWESFGGLIDRCDMAIVLAIKFQNLTTEITASGSYAAASQHGKGEVAQTVADNAAWANTIYTQLTRPFAAFNYGDPDLAPYMDWDVRDADDEKEAALKAMQFGQALNMMRLGGVKLSDPTVLARSMGIELGEIEHVEPLQVQVASSSGGSGVPDR